MDKRILTPSEELPELNIYIANDYGFCGNFNSEVSRRIKKDTEAKKIIIGKKIVHNDEKTLIKINKDDFFKRFGEIQEKVEDAIRSIDYSRINVFYNHYYSMSSFEFLKIQLFPTEYKGELYDGEDFVAETDLNGLISRLASFYVCYQLKMCESISYAADNVLRSQITSSALEKLDEKEKEERHEEMKRRKEKSVLKSVENFKKIAS